MAERSGQLADRAATAATWAAAGLVTFVFVAMLSDIVIGGLSALSWEFLTGSVADAGRAGGILPIIASTLAVVAVCMAVSVPVGLGAAVYLSDYTRDDSRLARAVRRSLDVLAGIPSIVFGLFGNAVFCKLFGLGFSIVSGGLTLACMVLPLLIRATEEGLRAVPQDLRLAGAALGMSRTSVLRTVVLPSAAPGLIIGLVLGLGRALAETAALIFTSGYVARMPETLFDSGRTLSVHIYDLAMNVPGGDANAYASALVLLAILLILTTIASAMTQRMLSARVTRLTMRIRR